MFTKTKVNRIKNEKRYFLSLIKMIFSLIESKPYFFKHINLRISNLKMEIGENQFNQKVKSRMII